MKISGDIDAVVNQLESQANTNIVYEQKKQGLIQGRIGKRTAKDKGTKLLIDKRKQVLHILPQMAQNKELISMRMFKRVSVLNQKLLLIKMHNILIMLIIWMLLI